MGCVSFQFVQVSVLSKSLINRINHFIGFALFKYYSRLALPQCDTTHEPRDS